MKKILIVFLFLLSILASPFLSVDISASEFPEEYSKTLLISGINVTRESGFLVYYDYRAYRDGKAPTNNYGYEVAVNGDGYIEEVGANVNGIIDGFILSGHGGNKTELMKLQVGDKVVVDLTLMRATITRTFQESTFARSKINYDKAKKVYKESSVSCLESDYETIDKLYNEIEEAYLEVTNLSSNAELNDDLRSALRENENIITNNYEKLVYLTSQTSKVDFRAIWHRPRASSIDESTLEGVKEFLSRVKAAGFNTVFLETYYEGYFAGKSKIVNTHPTLSGLDMGEYGDDYLKAFISEAGKLGIEVHAWCHTFMAGGTSYISDQIKDEWLLETYTGEKLHPNEYGGAYYLDPSNDEVVNYMANMYKEILTNYDFKGLQLDYIRYWDNNYNVVPYRDSGYGKLSEEKFLLESGLTGDVKEIVKTTSGREIWNEWRCNNITNAVKILSETIKKVNKDLIVSAAVVSNINDAKSIYMQDYSSWSKCGYIDLLCPMIYTGSVDAIKNSTISIIDAINDMSFVSSGIAPIYYGFSNMISHSQVVNGVIYSVGTSYFASQNIFSNPDGLSEAEKALIQGVYRNSAINPLTASVKDVMEQYYCELERIIAEASKRGYLENDNLLIGFILSCRNITPNNPSDYKKIIEYLTVLEGYAGQINDEYLVNLISSIALEAIDYLEVKTNRFLINNGYWNPEKSERPDVDSLSYSTDDELVDQQPELNPEPSPETHNCTSGFIQIISYLSILLLCLAIYRRQR